ncbi:hypothetical protein Zmor_008009 [Zophobas morio]|uniref:Uncharacterized protein n=1 Tax=Zophobas morio TaxID=2755281 RepID=A0AA38IUM2_9CUCU|nr:hypothetical protein Zmor_008009 [Zophobas morio]
MNLRLPIKFLPIRQTTPMTLSGSLCAQTFTKSETSAGQPFPTMESAKALSRKNYTILACSAVLHRSHSLASFPSTSPYQRNRNKKKGTILQSLSNYL